MPEKKTFSLFRKFDKKNALFNIAICFCIIVLLHIGGAAHFVDKCRSRFGAAKVSIFGCVEKVEKGIFNFLYFISNDVDGTLLKLHSEKLKLQEEVESLKNLRTENDELRKLLPISKGTPIFSPVVARITGVFLNDFTRSCLLNVGEADGVAVDNVIKNSDGLIGRIVEVNETWSRALFITDMNSNIPVKIGENQVDAVVTGCNAKKLIVSAIHEDVPIQEGDVVKTSGYGVCENIPVGKIEKDGKKLMIVPFVNFNSLKYVVVLRENV